MPSGAQVAAVPQLDGAAAVLALGDRALEVAIIQRMVFDFHGQALVMRIERRALGHGPGFEYPVEFEAEIIVGGGWRHAFG